MSEMSKKARAENRAKARRMTTAETPTKLDASDFTPAEPLHAGRKIYDRPRVRPMVYKLGGKIQGDRGPRRNDKLARGGYRDGGAAHLSTKSREKMPSKDFAFPGKGKGPKGSGAGSYPIEDKGHAKAALSEGAKHLSPAKDEALKRKVHHKFPNMEVAKRRGGGVHDGDGFVEGTRPTGGRIARADGGRAKKGKTNIIINVGGNAGGPPMPPPSAVTRPPVPMPPPAPPPGAGPGGPGGPPMPPPGMAGPPPVPGRKRGGMVRMKAGAGSGLGRLEKAKAYGEEC